MAEIASIVGTVGGVVAVLTAIFSVIYLRKQTLLMASQVDKEIEVKITRDLEAPEGVDTKLRSYLNRRLSDVRTTLRQEYGPRLDGSERKLEDHLRGHHDTGQRDIAQDALKLLSKQQDAVEGFEESNSKVSVLEHEIQKIGMLEDEIQALQQTVRDIRSGVGNQGMVRAQIRGIAEQLLSMTGQDEGVSSPTFHDGLVPDGQESGAYIPGIIQLPDDLDAGNA